MSGQIALTKAKQAQVKLSEKSAQIQAVIDAIEGECQWHLITTS